MSRIVAETTVSAHRVITMDMFSPIPEAAKLRAALREVSRAERADLMVAYPQANRVTVEIVMYCNAAQRAAVATLIGFIWASQFAAGTAKREDFGAFENFRFKWKH